MKSKTSKVLHPILGMEVLRYVIAAACEASIAEIVVVASPKTRAPIQALCDLVAAERDLTITVTVQAQARGTADAVRCGLEALSTGEGAVVVLCGDAPLLRGATVARFLKAHEARDAAVSVLSGEVDDPAGYGRIIRGADGAFAEIVEERDASEAERSVREINSGCLAFAAGSLRGLLEAVPPAPNGELYLTRTIDLARAQGLTVQAVGEVSGDEVLGINTRAQLAEARGILQRRINEGHMARGVTVVDPATAYIDPRVEIGEDSVIEPCVVIEGPVRIGEGCRVGPFARLRAASVVEGGAQVGCFVEMARSQLGAGSKALHLAYLGDTRVGAQANIGAGAVFANWDGKRHHEGVVGDGAFIGSGSVVVQPAGVEARGRTGAGAVVTRTVPAGETWFGVPARPQATTREAHP